jgi:hypothetical protein
MIYEQFILLCSPETLEIFVSRAFRREFNGPDTEFSMTHKVLSNIEKIASSSKFEFIR